MKWTDCRLVAFDTETTGLRSYDGDRIIEFGAVELFVDESGLISRVKPHQYLINPEIPIPREASAVSGIRDEDVRNKPPFAKVAKNIWELLNGALLVAGWLLIVGCCLSPGGWWLNVWLVLGSILIGYCLL